MKIDTQKWIKGGLWASSLALAVVFFASGLTKLLALPLQTELFESFGLPDWTLSLVGLVELCAAVLLVVPRLRFYGAAIVGVVMLGAAFTHLTTGVMQPMIFLNAALFLVAGWIVLIQGPKLPIFGPQDPGGHAPGV